MHKINVQFVDKAAARLLGNTSNKMFCDKCMQCCLE